MNWLVALPIALPLLIAAALVGVAPLCNRRLADIVALVTAVVCTGAAAVLTWWSAGGTLTSWFGGWTPRHGVAIGIAFAIDPLGGGLATFVGAMMTAALLYAWHYFDAVRTYFHALMLIFLAGMMGFALTGDLFNQFVFFELMSVAAYALTGYKVEDVNAVEGAINFAVTNTVGAFLVLMGIALVYGRTGALNLAQVGEALRHGTAAPIVPVALTLITAGLFVKAAQVPFHFWLADAHAVAPTPVCVLFSGVMIELGIYGVLRIYVVGFQGAPGVPDGRFRAALVTIGAVTAVLGAVMCFAQRHFKRLLAFSSVSHNGMILLGAAALTPKAVAGAALYLVGHGLVKGALFMCAGLFLHRLGGVDELELFGRARGARWLAATCIVAGLGLGGFPPFGTYVGKQLMEEAARAAGRPWISYVFLLASAVTAGAVLRFTASVCFGWGRPGDAAHAPTAKEKRETTQALKKVPTIMLTMAAVLAVAPVLVGVAAGPVIRRTEAAGARFLDVSNYTRQVLSGAASGAMGLGEAKQVTTSAVLMAVLAVVIAVALAGLALFRQQWPRRTARWAQRALQPPVSALRSLHSGNVADYVTWLAVGVVVFSVWAW